MPDRRPRHGRDRPGHAARRSAPASSTACRTTVCAPFWEYEFEVPDFNKFSDLARGPRPGRRPARRDRRAPGAQRALARVAHAHGRRRRAARDVQRRRPRLGPAARSTAPGPRTASATTRSRSSRRSRPIVGRALRLLADLASGAQRRRPRARDGDRRRRQPPRVRHPRGAGLVRATSSRSTACPTRARPRRARARSRSPRRTRAGARRGDRRPAPARARAAASGCSSTRRCLHGADGAPTSPWSSSRPRRARWRR